MFEIDKYFIDVGYSNLNKFGEELCGDKVEWHSIENGMVAVLSDGLGSGVKANILATLTSKIALTMLINGSSIEEVVSTLISTLPVCKVRELAYSTFTVVKVMNDGKVYIVRFDNPPVLLKRGDNVFPLEGEEHGVEDKTVKEIKMDMKEGDTLVSISDGVIHAGIGAILNFGWQLDNLATYVKKIPDNISALSISKKIVATCNHLYGEKPGDDTSVLVIKCTVPKKVTIFTGPPLNQEDDSLVVSKLLASGGKKIVCGGTAAKIVARETHQEIKVEMDIVNDEVPPIGYLHGIDLVTEGVLTLKLALEILNKYKNNIEHLDDLFIKNRDKNGIYLLLKTLLDEGTHIKFLFGRSINPAHKNFDFPQDLASKLEIVKKLKKRLIELGKVVEIEYF